MVADSHHFCTELSTCHIFRWNSYSNRSFYQGGWDKPHSLTLYISQMWGHGTILFLIIWNLSTLLSCGNNINRSVVQNLLTPKLNPSYTCPLRSVVICLECRENFEISPLSHITHVLCMSPMNSLSSLVRPSPAINWGSWVYPCTPVLLPFLINIYYLILL